MSGFGEAKEAGVFFVVAGGFFWNKKYKTRVIPTMGSKSGRTRKEKQKLDQVPSMETSWEK